MANQQRVMEIKTGKRHGKNFVLCVMTKNIDQRDQGLIVFIIIIMRKKKFANFADLFQFIVVS